MTDIATMSHDQQIDALLPDEFSDDSFIKQHSYYADAQKKYPNDGESAATPPRPGASSSKCWKRCPARRRKPPAAFNAAWGTPIPHDSEIRRETLRP